MLLLRPQLAPRCTGVRVTRLAVLPPCVAPWHRRTLAAWLCRCFCPDAASATDILAPNRRKPSSNPCDKNRVSLPVKMSPQREIYSRPFARAIGVGRAGGRAHHQSSVPLDDRSVCVAYVPGPVVDGSAAHVRGTAVFQAPCSPSDFAVLHRQLADGSAIRQRGRRNGTTRQPRALPLWNGQGERRPSTIPQPQAKIQWRAQHFSSRPWRPLSR